jgi:hypothetical protein
MNYDSAQIHKKSIIVDGLNACYPKDFNNDYIQKVKRAVLQRFT